MSSRRASKRKSSPPIGRSLTSRRTKPRSQTTIGQRYLSACSPNVAQRLYGTVPFVHDDQLYRDALAVASITVEVGRVRKEITDPHAKDIIVRTAFGDTTRSLSCELLSETYRTRPDLLGIDLTGALPPEILEYAAESTGRDVYRLPSVSSKLYAATRRAVEGKAKSFLDSPEYEQRALELLARLTLHIAGIAPEVDPSGDVDSELNVLGANIRISFVAKSYPKKRADDSYDRNAHGSPQSYGIVIHNPATIPWSGTWWTVVDIKNGKELAHRASNYHAAEELVEWLRRHGPDVYEATIEPNEYVDMIAQRMLLVPSSLLSALLDIPEEELSGSADMPVDLFLGLLHRLDRYEFGGDLVMTLPSTWFSRLRARPWLLAEGKAYLETVEDG